MLLDDRAKHAVILSKRREPDEEEASELYHIGVDESAASKPAAASSETKPGATEPVREIADTTSDATAEAETALAAPADKGGEPTGSSIDNNFGKEDATPAGAAVDNEDSEGSMQKIEHTDLDESPPSGFPTSGEPVPKDDTVNSERPDIDLYSQNEDANVDLEAYKRDQATDAAEMKDEKTDLDLYAQNTTSKVDLDTYKANQTAIASKSEDVGTKATPAAGSRGRASSVGGKTTRDPVTSTSRKATKPAAADLTSHKAAAVAQDQRSATRFADNAKAAAAKSRQDKQFELQIAAEEKALIEKEEKARLAEQRARQLEIEKETREEDRKRREEDRLEQSKIREEKRLWDADRREATRKAINSAVDLKAASLQDLEKVRAQNQFAERFSGMVENQEAFTFDPTAPRGPSQTVQYTSKFIDRLSDITDDMCVSGSLSIKAAKFGGSGRGSFVDSDKFKSSDLNFYISVKVINQTINFKDALTFNQLRSVGLDSEKFPEVYGDSFISGFLEGGEFNAVVSMKILNKAKMLDIKAEAKVALTTGPVDITAEANIGVARSNIDTNTETTIQVSWCGGGHIKPMEQQWDIKSLMSAASRFPDLVSECPQRTYAILTKYDTLRSFVALRPAEYSPLQYENAQMYTNALMDSFMTYKSLYKDLGEQIYTVQGKTLEIVSWEERDSENPPSSEVTPDSPTSDATTDPKDDLTRFEASLRGLSDARKAIRAQMTEIVNEVDVIEKHPKKATDKGHVEPYQSPVTFQTRLPEVRVPGNLRPKINPLTGKRIMAKPQTEEELEAELKEEEKAAQAPALYSNDEQMDMNTEKSVFDSLKTSRPGIGENLRVTTAVGATDNGEFFNNLDFIQKDWHVKSIRIEIARGAVAAIEVWYENGLLLRKGMVR